MTLRSIGIVVSTVLAPLIDFISLLKFPNRRINSRDYKDAKEKIRNGDMLASRADYELSNPMMPGYWKHVAIYLDGEVYQAVTAGVNHVTLEEFMFQKDHIGIYRVSDLEHEFSAEEIHKMRKFCEKQVGDTYDFTFEWGKMKRWYCSKLVYWAYEQVDRKYVRKIAATTVLGIKHMSPTEMTEGLIEVVTYEKP